MNYIVFFLCLLLSPLSNASIPTDPSSPKSPPKIKGADNTADLLTEENLEDQTEFEESEINVNGYKVKLKGFFSAAGGFTTAEQYTSTALVDPLYYGLGKKVTFESDSLAGLQLNAPVTDNSEVVLQIVARGRATDQITDKYELNANWAYFNYHFKDNLTIKVGRVLMPVYLLSQYADVAYAYPWVKPP